MTIDTPTDRQRQSLSRQKPVATQHASRAAGNSGRFAGTHHFTAPVLMMTQLWVGPPATSMTVSVELPELAPSCCQRAEPELPPPLPE